MLSWLEEGIVMVELLIMYEPCIIPFVSVRFECARPTMALLVTLPTHGIIRAHTSVWSCAGYYFGKSCLPQSVAWCSLQWRRPVWRFAIPIRFEMFVLFKSQ